MTMIIADAHLRFDITAYHARSSDESTGSIVICCWAHKIHEHYANFIACI
jgi:hypothetical protein